MVPLFICVHLCNLRNDTMFLSVFLDTPDTSRYMIAGYVVFTVLPLLFIASLAYRHRNLKRDEDTLKGLEDERNT